MRKRKLLNYMIEYIIMTINELSSCNTGEFWAYIECLEILSLWAGFKKFGIEDIERHFINSKS